MLIIHCQWFILEPTPVLIIIVNSALLAIVVALDR